VWMHNGFLQIEGEKMAKSLGNFFTVKDLLDKGVPGEVIRFVLLSTHYRHPLDWTEKRIKEARAKLDKWSRVTSNIEPSPDVPTSVVNALANDLDTWNAVKALDELFDEKRFGELKSGADLLGLELKTVQVIAPPLLRGGGDTFSASVTVTDTPTSKKISALLDERSKAKASKNFARADMIRDALKSVGVVIRDTPDGPESELTAEFDPAKLEALTNV